jgi:hypothetical protein
LVETCLAALDLKVKLIIGGFVKVLFEPTDCLLLKHVQVLVDLRELVLQFFGRLHPEGWKGLLLV